MSLTSRKHLGKQAENVDESGVQLRDTDPVSPVVNQTWINTTQRKLKTRTLTSTLVLAEGEFSDAIEIPPSNIIDLGQSRAYFKEILSDYELLDAQNFVEGELFYIRFDNPNINQNQIASITLEGPLNINDGDYWLIDSIDEKYYVWYDFNGANISDPNIPDRVGVPVEVTAGLRELTEFTAASASDITSGQYFNLNSANNSTEYYVWYNKDSLGGDPLIGGKTGIQIVIVTGDSQADVALKTASIINGFADFTSSSIGNNFSVENAVIGLTNDAVNVSVGGAFSINVIVQGVGADTPLFLAEQTASALNSLPDFTVPVPTTSIIEVTNVDDGFVAEPQDGNIGGNFNANVTQQGSGKVRLTLPMNFTIETTQDIFVEAQTTKLLTVIPSGALLLTSFTEYSL
jgi:hypothetical protein